VKLSRGKLDHQRAKIHAAILADPERSSHSIAVEVGCSTGTVIRQRGVLANMTEEEVNGTPHPGAAVTPAPVGNERTLRHGARSPRHIAPGRERYLVMLRERFPAVSTELLIVMATRMSQFDLVTTWLDANGILNPKRKGEVFGAAQFAERLARSFEQQHAVLVQMQAEADAPKPVDAESELAAIAEEVK